MKTSTKTTPRRWPASLARRLMPLRLLSASALLVATGCQSYTPKQLTEERVDQALAIPGIDELAGLVQQSQHPLLPPMTVKLDDGVDPDEAMALAVVLNPSLRVERARRGIAAAQTIQAGLLPNPQLSLSADVPVGGATAGTYNALGAGLSWDIGALIEHRANLDAAQLDERATLLDVVWQEWQVASAARLAVFQAAWQGRACDELQMAVDASTRTRDQLRQALDAEEATKQQLDAAELTRHGYVAQLRAAERARGSAVLSAKRALGLPPDADVGFVFAASSHTVDAPAAVELFDQARNNRPDLLALHAGYEAQEQRVRAAVLAQFPRLSVGLNAARDTGNVQTIGLGVNIDLPVFDRSQGRIASERATRELLFQEYTGRVFVLRAELFAVVKEIELLDKEIAAQQVYADEANSLVKTIDAQRQQQLIDLVTADQFRNNAVAARLELLALEQRRGELWITLQTVAGQLFQGQTP